VKIKQAKFMGTFPKVELCPTTKLPEFAFIGRSNVGKSSLINMLCGRKALAKTSSTPGKTQAINLFEINGNWQLADLPGYGYAKVSKSIREQFGFMIKNYLKLRTNLFCTFILIDVRLSPQEVDLEMINWMGENEVPFYIVFTKTDKLKVKELEQNIEGFKNKLLETWTELPYMFASSSKTFLGQEEILDFVKSAL
jgi:GTP-binding protein